MKLTWTLAAIFLGALGAHAQPQDASLALKGLSERLQKAWNPDCGMVANRVNVTVSFRIGPDGNLIGRPTASKSGAASDRAVSAVQDGAPYTGLPPDAYGKMITVSFDGAKVCAGR